MPFDFVKLARVYSKSWFYVLIKYLVYITVRSTQACDTWSIVKSLRRNIPIHTFEGISLRD